MKRDLVTGLVVAGTLAAAAVNGELAATAAQPCESLASLRLPNATITLAHANISQTDTYLNASSMSLHESMKQFDSARICKTFASEGAKEQRPPCKPEMETAEKSLLH